MKLILASGSVSRKAILAAAHVPFDAIPADLDEAGLTASLRAAGTPPGNIALELAIAKARKVSQSHPLDLVLGADQTLLFEDKVIGKSASIREARALLLRLRGRTHCLVGGIALVRGGRIVWQHSETSRLTMRGFTDRFLEDYLAVEGESILSCVGCYRLEGPGAQLFDRIEGDYFSILGLSLQPLLAELRKQGVLQT